MITYLNELGLPKEWSKKKKLPLYFCQYFSAETPTDEFQINADKSRVFLTIDGAVTTAIVSLMKSGVSIDDMKTGIFAIVEINYNATELNSIPLYHDPLGNALDPEFDLDTLSFNFTTNGKTYSDMTISMTKVTDATVDLVDGSYIVRQFNMRPVINNI